MQQSNSCSRINPLISNSDLSNAASDTWVDFEQMLHRLHQEGIYIHSEQLAEFLLFHGLPVNLRYVPSYLQQKAKHINEHYQGDMVALVEELAPY